MQKFLKNWVKEASNEKEKAYHSRSTTLEWWSGRQLMNEHSLRLHKRSIYLHKGFSIVIIYETAFSTLPPNTPSVTVDEFEHKSSLESKYHGLVVRGSFTSTMSLLNWRLIASSIFTLVFLIYFFRNGFFSCNNYDLQKNRCWFFSCTLSAYAGGKIIDFLHLTSALFQRKSWLD